MVVKLKMVNSNRAGSAFALKKFPYLIGRHKECDLRVNSTAVSVHHCAILLRGDEVWVKDMGSTNGTRVNGADVPTEVRVANGDKLEVGPATMEFVLETNDPEQAAGQTTKENAILGADFEQYPSTQVHGPGGK